ncbi:MAG TPA: HemK2/MTQ2 family protein methyltransferase [Candidatus Nitrosotenuis sp.]|nr:HemK2/MTQ2 family protein methyltransferase [Candidatus Nitrosotenuis sp.]
MQNKLSDTYTPAEDTFFLAECVAKERGESALEIGTGSGYLAGILQKNFDFVVATDVDFGALRGQAAKVHNKICCDGANALGKKFDLIVCNLPYLPSEKIIDKTTDGGPEGLLVPLDIIESASHCIKPGGKMLFLTSSLANYQKLVEKVQSLGFSATITAKKKLFFEELIIIEAKLLS